MSDVSRANWSMTIALVVSILAALPFVYDLVPNGKVADSVLAMTVYLYLVAWPSFVVTFLVWTHLVFAGQTQQSRLASVKLESRPRSWWLRVFSFGGATSWTMTAAIVAVLLTVVIAQDSAYRSNWIYVALGMLTVASSWALMVYSFALQYFRLDTVINEDEGEARHLNLGLEGETRFGDYLTLAVLLSTMAATVSAKIHSRTAWSLVRANVLFAFTFNTVIVAMMVSLLFGGLLA